MKLVSYLAPLAGLVILAGCAENGSGVNSTPGTTPGTTNGTGTSTGTTGTGMGNGADTGTGAASSGATGSGASATGDAGANTTDKMGFATLGTNIKAALVGNAKTKGMQINVDVNADTVNLSGTVASQAEKDEAEKVARKVMDDHKAVQKLKNDLVLGSKGSASTDSNAKG